MTVSEQPVQTAYVDTTNPGGFRHIPALDGVRGLAILLVLGDHLLWANNQTGSVVFNFLVGVRESLWIGVNLFFALSGFLITGILWDTLHKPNFFRNFYARRSLRIFPLYYGVLLTLLALTHVLHFEWNHWQYFYLTYTANLALWGMGGLGLPHVNINHFWSLQVEEQFYLVWPLVVYRLRNQRRLICVALSACVAVLGIRTTLVIFHSHFTNQYLTMSPTFSCADNLLFGCTLALLLRTQYRQRVLDLAPRIFAICFVCLLAMAASDHGLLYFNSAIQQTIGASLLGIGSSALIAMALLPKSRTARLFDLPILRFFGKYSYGLYVYHYTLSTIFTMPLREVILKHTHSKAISVVGGALIVAGISMLVALLSYHLYEVQFLKLKRFFGYHAGKAHTNAASIPLSETA
jgi:peptidoglycan/LPS O-acetylase OafA/YrhL